MPPTQNLEIMKPSLNYTLVFDGDASELLRMKTMDILQRFMDYGMSVSEAIPVAVELAINTQDEFISEKQLNQKVYELAKEYYRIHWN